MHTHNTQLVEENHNQYVLLGVCVIHLAFEKDRIRESVSTPGSHHSVGTPPQASSVTYIHPRNDRRPDQRGRKGILSTYDARIH